MNIRDEIINIKETQLIRKLIFSLSTNGSITEIQSTPPKAYKSGIGSSRTQQKSQEKMVLIPGLM